MSSRPAKRPRYSTDELAPPSTAVNVAELPDLVSSLKNDTIADLLVSAAEAHSDVASLVQDAVNRAIKAERAKVIDFDYLSKSAWKTLNVTYERLSGSHAYDLSEEALESIDSCFETIREECPRTASLQTKTSALETMRKIGKSICLSVGVVPHEIRKDYAHGGELLPTMRSIVEGLEHEEKVKLRPWCDDKLVELARLMESDSIREGLTEIIDLFISTKPRTRTALRMKPIWRNGMGYRAGEANPSEDYFEKLPWRYQSLQRLVG